MLTMTTLKENFDYFLAHKDELVKQFSGKYVVIADQQVQGAYDDEITAIEETEQHFALGSFIVQKVEPGDTSYSATFHSRVSFV